MTESPIRIHFHCTVVMINDINTLILLQFVEPPPRRIVRPTDGGDSLEPSVAGRGDLTPDDVKAY